MSFFKIIIFFLPLMSPALASDKEVTIFFVRGLTRESSHSQFFFNYINKSCKICRIVSYDIPGNGRFIKNESFLSIQENTNFLREFWLKESKSKANIIFGVSLGGMIVMDWLKRFPDDFNRFVIANSSDSAHCGLFERVKPTIYLNLLQVALPFTSKIKEQAIVDMTLNLKHNHDVILRNWIEIRDKRPVSFINVLRQMIAGFKFKINGALDKEKLKLIVSEKDMMVSSLCTKRIADFFESELFTHKTAGHDITTDDPEWVLNHILKISN